MKTVLKRNIETCHKEKIFWRPSWKPLHLLPMFQSCPKSELNTASFLQKKIVNLPSSAFYEKKRSNSCWWRRHCNACLDVLGLLNLYNVVGIIEKNSFKLEKLHNVSVFKDQETEKLSKIYRTFL